MQPGELNNLFIQTHHVHFKRAHTRFGAYGLGEGQPRLLKHLACEDGLSQAELARRSNLEPATVTVGLNRLEKAGLVERRADADDLRITRIWLTKSGRELDETLGHVFIECEEECFEGFAPEEREQFAGFLRRMKDNMQRAEDAQGKPGEGE